MFDIYEGPRTSPTQINQGADPERICEFGKFQCEKMSATMVDQRRKL